MTEHRKPRGDMPVLMLKRKGFPALVIAPGDTVALGYGQWEVSDPKHPKWTIDNWPREGEHDA